jgi:hypothetical protein
MDEHVQDVVPFLIRDLPGWMFRRFSPVGHADFTGNVPYFVIIPTIESRKNR